MSMIEIVVTATVAGLIGGIIGARVQPPRVLRCLKFRQIVCAYRGISRLK